MPVLSREAFLPRQLRERHSERREWLANRDQLFAAATPREQEVLVAMAQWESNCRYEVIARPNLFSKCKEYLGEYKMALVFYAISGRELPPKPNAVIRSLGRMDRGLVWLELRLAKVQRRRFVAHLLRQVNAAEEADVLMGVCLVLSTMKLEPDGMLASSLSALLNHSFFQRRTPATRRLDRAISLCEVSLFKRWRDQHLLTSLLLEVAEQDLAAAVRYLDEEALREKDGRYNRFLEGRQPEVLTRLATLLHGERPVLAQDMLTRALYSTEVEIGKHPASATASLHKVMDASCVILAQWTLQQPQADKGIESMSLRALLRYGDPNAPYWSIVLERSWSLCQQYLVGPGRREPLFFIEVAFYTEPESAFHSQAIETFDALVAESLSSYKFWSDTSEAFFFRQPIQILSDLALLDPTPNSRRNRRFQAAPDHPMNQVLRRNFQRELEARASAQSVEELPFLIDFALDLCNDAFAAECHEQITSRFEPFARRFSNVAGLYLRELGRRRSYNTTKLGCQSRCAATFARLLPVLETISLEDAAVARSAENWDPRGNIERIC